MKSKKNTSDRKEEGTFDYEKFEQEAISKLRAGKGLTGPEGALSPNLL